MALDGDMDRLFDERGIEQVRNVPIPKLRRHRLEGTGMRSDAQKTGEQ